MEVLSLFIVGFQLIDKLDEHFCGNIFVGHGLYYNAVFM